MPIQRPTACTGSSPGSGVTIADKFRAISRSQSCHVQPAEWRMRLTWLLPAPLMPIRQRGSSLTLAHFETHPPRSAFGEVHHHDALAFELVADRIGARPL